MGLILQIDCRPIHIIVDILFYFILIFKVNLTQFRLHLKKDKTNLGPYTIGLFSKKN